MTVLDHSHQLSDHNVTTPPEQCPHWCEQTHGPGEPCESVSFDVATADGVRMIRLIQTGDAAPRMALDPIGPAHPYTVEIGLDAAEDLIAAVAELVCIARRCDCWRTNELCPGNPMYGSYAEFRKAS